MNSKSLKEILPQPRLAFDRVGQITFTLKEVIKLAFSIKPKLLVLVFILNAFWGLTAVPGFYLEKLIIDTLLSAAGNPNWKPVFNLAIFYVGLSLLLSLLRNFLSSLNGFLRRNLSRYFDAELDVRLGQKVSELSLSTLEDPEFRDRFNKVERESGRRAWQLMMPLSDIPNYLLGFISSAGVLALVHPLVALGVFLISIPRLLIDSRFIKKEYEYHTQTASKNRIWSWLRHYLVNNRNFMELKILGLSDLLTSRMRKVAKETLRLREELSKKRELFGLFGLFPLSIFEFGLSVLLVFWVIIGRITIGSLQLYLRSLRSAEQNLTGLVSSFLEIYENYMYVTDLVWFLNLEVEEKSIGYKKLELKGSELSIEFKNVWFAYKKNDPWVLRGVSFKINPGEKIALVGENGAGKSTLIKLLSGFYRPQKGEIKIGGKNVGEIDLLAWRNDLAVLFQEFELYPFSVKETIGFGDIARIDKDEEIKEAIKKTGLNEFIDNLSKGYETPLSPELEGGIRPSIGQWQRLGIARVLFRKRAKVLILDEPTSNVDPEAEEKIFNELVEVTKNKLLIFVTQRYSTVRIADRIFVMNKGQIVEEGTHNELMKKEGKYKRLFTLQAQAYLDNAK